MKKTIMLSVIFNIFLSTASLSSQTVKKNISYSDINGFLTEWAEEGFYPCFERKFKNFRVIYAEIINNNELKVTGKVRYTKYKIPADREFTAIISSNSLKISKECITCSKKEKECKSGVSKYNKYWKKLFN